MNRSDPDGRDRGSVQSSGLGTAAAGFYGKLPTLGDFITRRLPAQFIQPWDLWLRESLTASQGRLGASWLDHYLTSPLWRFALSPGVAGQSGWLGVLMPSVDRVGRYVPLTRAAPFGADANPFRALCALDWLERVEDLALSCLVDSFDQNAFEAEILALGAPSFAVEPPTEATANDEDRPGDRDAWRVAVQSPARLTDACPTLLARALQELYCADSLWSTSGSERIAPSLLACQGLPAPGGFASLLGGGWTDQGWLQLGRGG